MLKKSAQKAKRQKDSSIKLTLIILGSFLLFVATLVFIQFKAQAGGPCALAGTCIHGLSGKPETNNKGTFMGRDVAAPKQNEKSSLALSEQNVLGDSTSDNKHIYVDLTNQRLYAYEGNNKVYDFPVSTGKWSPTPTGNFRIHVWLRYTRMSGGNPALGTYYNLPNVPYTMYFGNSQIPWSRGYSLHGAYWHNNFGHPMSHGCVNMKIDDVGKIYSWTNPNAGNVAYETKDNPGTLITIYGTAPIE